MTEFIEYNYDKKWLALSEVGRQVNEIMFDRSDPLLRERKRIEENRLKRMLSKKIDLGL